MGDGVSIVLPEDGPVRKALEGKLTEYRGRLKNFQSEHPEVPSEVALRGSFSYADSVYKTAIVEKLLEAGKVYLPEVAFEVNKKYGAFSEPAFFNAAAVINDYCTTEGANSVDSPTGFHVDRS